MRIYGNFQECDVRAKANIRLVRYACFRFMIMRRTWLRSIMRNQYYDLGRNKFSYAILEDHKMFERFCFKAYSSQWNDTNAIFVGSHGKEQYGLDIVGTDRYSDRRIGVQCKNYNSPITMSAVEQMIQLVENQNRFSINHLIIAVPSTGVAAMQAEVAKLSDRRKAAGKFTVSMDYSGEITHRLGYAGEASIVKAFPNILPGFGWERVAERFPLDERIADVMATVQQVPGRMLSSRYHDQKFDDWVTKDCFSEQPHRSNQHVTLPITGFDPEHFCSSVYVKDQSSYFRDCNRTVDVEGFDLHFSNHKLKMDAWEPVYAEAQRLGVKIDDTFVPEKYLSVRCGYFQQGFEQAMSGLRAAGCVRIVWPLSGDANCPFKKVLKEDFSFTEHPSASFLTSML